MFAKIAAPPNRPMTAAVGMAPFAPALIVFRAGTTVVVGLMPSVNGALLEP
jgi:hypothetical protein